MTPRPTKLGHFRRPLVERVAERCLALVAASAIFAIVFILLFVVREALPILWEDHGALSWRDLFLAREYPGYDHPIQLWQPVGHPPKFHVLPLFLGSLKVAGLAMLISLPLALLCALYVAEMMRPGLRAVVKPSLELASGVPSVVIGFFALAFVAGATQDLLGCRYRLNALVAAIALSISVLPVVFTVSEDAIRAVPHALREASLALGATSSQTIVRVVLPAALPGIAAAMVLGFGRAIGETMIVLMASGNAAVMDLSPTSSARTVTATLASELGETARGSEHWRVLFLLGALLLVLTALLDTLGQALVRHLRRRLYPDSRDVA